MKYTMQVFATTLFTLATFGLLASPLSAQVSTTEERQEIRQENREQARQDFIENRCERVKDRVQRRVDRYKQRRDFYVERYNNIQSILTNIANTFEAQGYDVSDLRSQLITLDNLIIEFRNNNKQAFEALITSGDFACAENREQFEQNVSLAKEFLAEVRAGAKEIRDYVQGTIRPELQDLREEIRADVENQQV